MLSLLINSNLRIELYVTRVLFPQQKYYTCKSRARIFRHYIYIYTYTRSDARRSLRGKMYLAGNERLEVFVIIRLLPGFRYLGASTRKTEISLSTNTLSRSFSRSYVYCMPCARE